MNLKLAAPRPAAQPWRNDNLRRGNRASLTAMSAMGSAIHGRHSAILGLLSPEEADAHHSDGSAHHNNSGVFGASSPHGGSGSNLAAGSSLRHALERAPSQRHALEKAPSQRATGMRDESVAQEWWERTPDITEPIRSQAAMQYRQQTAADPLRTRLRRASSVFGGSAPAAAATFASPLQWLQWPSLPSVFHGFGRRVPLLCGQAAPAPPPPLTLFVAPAFPPNPNSSNQNSSCQTRIRPALRAARSTI